MVAQRPRAADPDEDLRPVALGQQVTDIPLLVAMTPMHERVLAEHVPDRLAQRLAAVDHEQDRLLRVEAAVDEVGEQHGHQRRVLRRAFPQPERDLHALSADPERDDVRALSDLEPVEHHHRQARVIQPAAHQLTERGAGALDEQLRHRRLRRRARFLLDALADRLADHLVLAGRDAGEHPVHHRPRERVTISEVLVALDGQFVLVVSRADPRTVNRNAPTAERHRPVLVTVTLRRPVGVVLVLRAHDLVDFALHQLMHDAETETNAQREQPLPRCPNELAECLLNLRRQRQLRRLPGRDDLRAGYLLHGGPPVPDGLGLATTNAPNRSGRAGRTASNFYELPDNLGTTAPGLLAAVSIDPVG